MGAQVEFKRGVPRGPDRVQPESCQAIADYYPDTAALHAAMDQGLQDLRTMLQQKQELCGRSLSVWESLLPGHQQPDHPLPLLPASMVTSDDAAEQSEEEADEEEENAQQHPTCDGLLASALDNEGMTLS